MVLGIPDRFAQFLANSTMLFRERNLAESVSTNGIQRSSQSRILLHVLQEVHLPVAPITKAMKLHILEASFVHGSTQVLGKVVIVAFLVVTA